MSVAALQETKWFGVDAYKSGGSVVLTAGRDVPDAGQRRQKGEGIAIVLSGEAIHAWKAGGSQWKAWSSRLVTATLEIGNGRLHILSCYAPTFIASREEKGKFYKDLQAAVSSVPSNECFGMLGDFNARVGSRGVDDDWWYERGPHEYDEINEAGKELMSFLSINEATVCNTWFKKREIHKRTWQHPKSLKWHCIDYVIMRKGHRRKCLDVSVMRGADCNTDHKLLRVKVVVGKKKSFSRDAAGTAVRRWDVSKLKGRCVDERGRETSLGSFVRSVNQRLQEEWDGTKCVQEKWDTLKTALCDGAKTELGYEIEENQIGLERVRKI